MKNKSFNVYTYSKIKDDSWHHWADGLNMIIEKNGVSLHLHEDELKQLVKSLPKTVGGRY